MKIGSENQFSIDKMTFLTKAKEKPLEVSTQQTQEMVVQDVYTRWCVWLLYDFMVYTSDGATQTQGNDFGFGANVLQLFHQKPL